jgi:hypothetical protein
LTAALHAAGASPKLMPLAHPAARIAALWRGGVPILTRGDVIWWQAAPADLSARGRELGMATLQHELQHVLDYRTGHLTAVGYLTNPKHWIYHRRAEDARGWDELGAEQRASMAEQLWLVEHGFDGAHDGQALRHIIPWA